MISFSQKVLEYKNSFKSVAEAIEKTNLLFDEKYFLGAKQSAKFTPPFIPGKIYSFYYKTPSEISDSRKFINRNPIVLCIDSFKSKDLGTILKGIDLVTVPPDFRVTVLGRIYDRFHNILESPNPSPLPINETNLKSLLIGTGHTQSIFGFKSDYFGEIYQITTDDWFKIPYLSKSFIEGLDLQGIYREYKLKLI